MILTYEGVGTPEPGDFIYKDLNGDGVINDRDKAPIGYSSLLPRINYGFSLSANWKGFDVSIMLQGVGQYSKTYSGAGIYESSGNFYKMHMERWSAIIITKRLRILVCPAVAARACSPTTSLSWMPHIYV